MNWQDRITQASRGTQTGAIVACALKREIPAPHYIGRASVTSDGFLMCSCAAANGAHHMGAFVGSLSDLIENCVKLSKHVKLTVHEQAEFCDSMVEWIDGLSDYSNGRDKLRRALTWKKAA